ncbi:MAG TPA: hypothetical protein VD994_05750, partial [Prosthecobacter sp.]|nr:hypothetical protein [Prosthecobacter sp.]
VFIDGRWTRLNYTKLDQNILDERCYGLLTHTLTFHDLSETSLASTWGLRYAQGKRSAELKTANPFATLELSDHFGRHARTENPEVPPAPADHRSLTIDSVYWLRSEKRPAWLKTESFANQEKTGVIALMHCAEWFANQDYRQLRRFIDRAETGFILRAPGQPEIRARVTGNYTSHGERAIGLTLTKEAYSQMVPGHRYALTPIPSGKEVVWKVKEGMVLVREETEAAGR